MSVDRETVQFLSFTAGKAQLVPADCFDWLQQRDSCSIQAVVTDPPYGLIEYTEKEQQKLRKGRGGVCAFRHLLMDINGRHSPVLQFSMTATGKRYMRFFSGWAVRYCELPYPVRILSWPAIRSCRTSLLGQ